MQETNTEETNNLEFTLEESLNNSTNDHLFALNARMDLHPRYATRDVYIENILREIWEPRYYKRLLRQIRGRDFLM